MGHVAHSGIRAALMGACAALCLPLHSCAPTGDAQAGSPAPADDRSSDLSKQFYREVNRYRASKGRSALARHRGLDQLARQHAHYLLENRGKFGLHGSNVSHYGFKARSHKARVAYGFGAVGENVAGGQSSVSQTVTELASSPNHNHSMLNSWSSTGCAVVRAPDGALFTVQIFGSLPVSQSQMWRDQLAGY